MHLFTQILYHFLFFFWKMKRFFFKHNFFIGCCLFKNINIFRILFIFYYLFLIIIDCYLFDTLWNIYYLSFIFLFQSLFNNYFLFPFSYFNLNYLDCLLFFNNFLFFNLFKILKFLLEFIQISIFWTNHFLQNSTSRLCYFSCLIISLKSFLVMIIFVWNFNYWWKFFLFRTIYNLL